MNKTSKYIFRAVATVATAMFFIATLLIPSYMNAAKKNSSTSPDFAYPQTVEANADKNLKNAIDNGDWQKATLAMIQKITAKNLVSRENVSSSLNELDSMVNVAPEAWKPALLLIEADIYNAIYNANRWKSNQRELPMDSLTENPYEWSKDIFANKILSLCTSIFDNHSNDGKPLCEWREILSNSDDAIKYGMTIDEFLADKCTDLLNNYADETQDVIPFFASSTESTTPGGKCRDLQNKAIAYLIDQTSTLGQTMLEAEYLAKQADFQPYSMRSKYLLEALGKVSGTEGEQLILQKHESYVDSGEEETGSPLRLGKKEYAGMLQQSIRQFPNGKYVNALKNILANYQRPNVDIEYQSQYLTSSDIKMSIKMSNCNEAWILIYDYAKYANARQSPSISTLAANCKLAKAVKVTADGILPFSAKVTAEVGELPVGIYVAVPSSTSNNKGIYSSIAKQTWHQPFTVSDISALTLNQLDGTTRVLVVDGNDGHPIEGAEVNIYTRKNYSSDRKLTETLTTDKDGSVIVKEKNFEFDASFNGSKWNSNTRIYNNKPSNDTTTYRRITILPDRSIYHPGDSISAVIIAYSSKEKTMSLDKDTRYTVKLHDANGKVVATQDTVTDRFGRMAVEFKIPEDGLLGQCRLSATDGHTAGGNAYFQVADYVAPTFFITAEGNDDEEVELGDEVILKGQVLTYSGMPLANATVNYTVRYRTPMRWWASSGATYSSSATTDTDGKYEIKLPTSNLKGTQFEKGVFTVEISATSQAGETQSGPNQLFALGQEYSIYPQLNAQKIEISNGVPAIKFIVEDILGRKVSRGLKYTLENLATGTIVAEGTCMSPNVELPSRQFESAKYSLKVSLSEDSSVKAESTFVMWRKSDASAPAGTELWIPENLYQAKPGDTSVGAVVGSGKTDRWLPIALSGNNKILEFKWIHIEKDNQSISLPVPSGKDTYILNVDYISDLKQENASISVRAAEYDNNLEITTESFRDKISAGDEEHWKFRFEKKYGELGSIPVMAVMTDAALNHLAPFEWSFNPSTYRNSTFSTFSGYRNINRSMDYNLKNNKYLSWKSIYFPQINDYGQNWGLYGYSGGVVYASAVTNELHSVQVTSRSFASEMKMSKMDMAAPMGASEDDEITVEVAEEADAGYMKTPQDSDSKDTSELRETECPVAFFMPYLTTDKDGVVDINFTVPNFNTTWQLQVLGYDASLQTAYKKFETVASKPVMVSAHSPRFVRTGDVIELTATLFNNTDVDCMIGGNIQLVNLMTGKTITSKKFDAENIGAMASRVITMRWEVPSDVSAVGFRAYAEGNGHRDGEQALVPVLPTSSPVTEATPFWLAPNQKVFEIQLPKFKDSDKVTLQYCDNPAWYCLTALPDIMETDSKSNLAKAFALYGNAMAYNLISSSPSLKKGLEKLLSDQNSEFAALKSNLEKDGNLKIAKLNNTPWVNDAESETLRMSRLSTLLDSVNAEKVISEQLGSLKKIQTPEGGWSWCPEMQPSVFITSNIIYNFAMMEQAGALGKFGNTSDMIRSAVGFVDKELVEQYHKYHKKDESLSYLMYWILTRSSLNKEDIPTGKYSSEMETMISKAVKDIASEWKDYGIREKGEAAIVLWRKGQKDTAFDILESLRQYASEAPQKGVWFDNINSGFYGSSALATTTMVLKAFAEIEPDNKLIDGLRQWLILSRQTEDWGRNVVTVNTINTILNSGSDWTNNTDVKTPEFRLKSSPIKLPETAALTGAFTVNLDAKQASGKKLKITRSGNSPAWGGVISQYETPLKDIKAANLPEMSIRKELVALVDEGNGTLVPKAGITLKKGMKVRVTLTISTDRDMDYVALTDERSACLEPTDQLSHYTASEGVWYYKEVHNENTNLYFDFLPKGHHVISYNCTVAQDGTFSCGIATLQSQYSPTLVCHSAAEVIEVK